MDEEEQIARIRDAMTLAWLLPKEIPLPEFYIDGDGDIQFEWFIYRHTSLIMWCRDGHVSYSALFDKDGYHGRNDKQGEITAECMWLLRRIADADYQTPSLPESK